MTEVTLTVPADVAATFYRVTCDEVRDLGDRFDEVGRWMAEGKGSYTAEDVVLCSRRASEAAALMQAIPAECNQTFDVSADLGTLAYIVQDCARLAADRLVELTWSDPLDVDALKANTGVLQWAVPALERLGASQ